MKGRSPRLFLNTLVKQEGRCQRWRRPFLFVSPRAALPNTATPSLALLKAARRANTPTFATFATVLDRNHSGLSKVKLLYSWVKIPIVRLSDPGFAKTGTAREGDEPPDQGDCCLGEGE